MLSLAMQSMFYMENEGVFRMFSRQCKLFFCAFLFLFMSSASSEAVTKAEFLYGVFTEIGFTFADQKAQVLPPDVDPDHSYSNVIRSSVQYGILSNKRDFQPDSQITKNEALITTLSAMGWGDVIALTDKLAELPELSGSGNPISFLCSEIEPKAPDSILIDGESPLSNEELTQLKNWIAQCKAGMVWNKVYSFNATDLILYKQGLGSQTTAETKFSAQPALFIAALAINPTVLNTEISFASTVGVRQQATLSEIAKNNLAIGGINGGFFHAGMPIGALMEKGIPLGSSFLNRSAIGLDKKGNVSFGPGTMQAQLKINDLSFAIGAFSRPPKQHEISLYSSFFTPTVKNIPQGALLLHIDDGVVVNIIENTGQLTLPTKGQIIVVGSEIRHQFTPFQAGTPAIIKVDWQHTAFEEATTVLQAGPMLLENASFAKTGTESFKSDILDKRHPRTFVGRSNDGRLIWGVVDGRNSMHSVGATISETKQLALSLGLVDALNLDGGGSSSLWWRGFIVNRPSDGKERPIPYAIIFTERTASN